jgi:hypothetical protein
MKMEEGKDKERERVVPILPSKNAVNSKNKTSTLITSSHPGQKSKEFVSNEAAYANLIGQKLSGPKISTIKR